MENSSVATIIGLAVSMAIAYLAGYKTRGRGPLRELLLNQLKPTNEQILASYRAVSCPSDAIVIAHFGQSNSANYVQPQAAIDIPDNLVQYDWKSDQCFGYREPLLGADGCWGNVLTYTAVAIAQASSRPVIVVPWGVGGSSVLDWAEGNLSYQHDLVLDRLQRRNLVPQIILWHQGESDTGPMGSGEVWASVPYFSDPSALGFRFGLTTAIYERALTTIIHRTLRAFPDARFGVALASRCESLEASPCERLRQAQQNVAATDGRVFIAADSDRVWGQANRYDGCHFSALGAQTLACDYYQAIAPILGLPESAPNHDDQSETA
ncbi:MAG: sialate O-acetylesterase [Cyanobacteria bacterium J06638_6]